MRSQSCPLDQITPALLSWLRRLEPFGMGNEEPVFVSRNVRILAPPLFMKEKHVRLRVAPGHHLLRRRLESRRPHSHHCNSGQTPSVDLAWRLRDNDHPEFGGLELEIAGIEPSP